MHSLNVTYRPPANKALSRDLVDLLFNRIVYGKAVVVTDKPHILHSAVKKRWLHMLRRLKIEQARTLNKDSKSDILSRLNLIENTTFCSQTPLDDLLDAKITFLNADDCARIAPTCYTLCVTYDFPKEKLHLMTAWMPKSGLIVIYGSN